MKEKVFVAKVDDLIPRIGREVHYNDKTIALFRLSNDEIKAVNNKCPHKEGPLADGTVSGNFVFCPLHDYKISLEDGNVQEPDDGCVETYQTVVEDGDVYLVLEQ